MKAEEDFVAASCKRIEEIAVRLGISRDVAQMIGAEWDTRTRREDGGCEVYIAKTGPDAEARKRRAIEEVQRTGRVAESADNNGISRRTLYRLLNR